MLRILKPVDVKRKINPSQFLKFLSVSDRRKLKSLARSLRGRKIVQVNATASGGGVAVLLRGLLPYMRSLGVRMEWYVINGEAESKFFSVTNKIHNALHGKKVNISAREWRLYESVNKRIAGDINKLKCDVLVINDPQPLFAVNHIKDIPVVYHSHVDSSRPEKAVWGRLLSSVRKFDRIIFSNRDFVNNRLPKSKVVVFTPAIDPLDDKQKIIPLHKAKKMLERYGIKRDAPHIVQVSRFDVFKNPIGVIDAFIMTEKKHPNIQLTLAGFNTATDNPEAFVIYKIVKAAAAGRKNIHIFFDPRQFPEIKDVLGFSGVIQSSADIIVQNSNREGFGLTVTEAMWRGKPVIGGPASGIKKQIEHGRNGYIAKDSRELARRISFLLDNPAQARHLGKEAHRTVLKKFLLPRLVIDHLALYGSLRDHA